MRLPPADGTEPLTLRKKLDNVQLYVAACSSYLHKIATNLFTNYFGLYLELMDYPESDDDGALATDGAAMLDEEDTEQVDGPPSCINPTVNVGNLAGLAGPSGAPEHAGSNNHGQKCPSTGSSFMSCGSQDKPELPPIYRTVRKEREKSMVTRHLYGGAGTETECTDSGASVSKVETIGSFANAGDKRHNHTMHRYDFKNIRNLSTSFNTSNLVCTTCSTDHTVLRRDIEEADVGMDIPPVFVLSDQNFPSMIPAGGGRGW
jgi:hypothetical protein